MEKLYIIDETYLRKLLVSAARSQALMEAHVDYCWQGYDKALDDFVANNGDFKSLIEEELKMLADESKLNEIFFIDDKYNH